jgi:hypothetical protein
MRLPRVPGRWWLLGSPHLAGFPHPQQVRTFPVCRAPWFFASRQWRGRCRSDVVVGLHCAGRDDRPRPRVGSREGRGLAPVVALRFRVALLCSCAASSDRWAWEWNLGELCWPHARRFLLLSLNFVATSIEYLGS